MDLFVPASRKVKFHCNCILHEASNLPFVSGRYFGKWKVLHGHGSAKGATSKIGIKDHQVIWNSSFEFDVISIIGKDKLLQPTPFKLSIKQEMGDGRAESIGSVILNLSEFAIEKTSTRKILLQQSKVNSFIKITLTLILVKGDRDTFIIPPPTASSGLDISGAIKPHDTQSTHLSVSLSNPHSTGTGLSHPVTSLTEETPLSLTMGRLNSIGNSAEHAMIIDQIFQSVNNRKETQ